MSILIDTNKIEKIMTLDSDCPCCSGSKYSDCCLPFHEYEKFPATAEKLMKSRFSAFELHLSDYLLKTWDESTRPGNIEFTSGLRWNRLVINGRKKGRKKDQEGWVTFVAYYQMGVEEGSLHEKSFFRRNENEQWQYVDGEIKP